MIVDGNGNIIEERRKANIMGTKTTKIEKDWYNKRSGKRKGYKVVVVK